MNVPTLQNIALFACVKHKWQNSELPELSAQIAYRPGRYGKNPYRPEDNSQSLKATNDDVCEQIMGYEHLPNHIKLQWACALSGLSIEICNFAVDIGRNLRKNTLTNTKFCVERIIISQDGNIKKEETLLNILKESKFLVEIYNRYLIDNFITEDTIRNLSEEVLCLTKIKRTKRKKDSDNNPHQLAIQRILLDYDFHYNDATEMVRYGDIIEWADMGNIPAMKFCYTEIKPGSLLDTARYVIKREGNMFQTEALIFCYQNMNYEEWKQLVSENSGLIINCLLGSWRYRHMSIDVYKIALNMDHYNAKSFRNLLCNYSWTWDFGTYQAQDICQVLKIIWSLTPEHIQEEAIQSDELASLIIRGKYFELLRSMLEKFSVDTKQKVFAKIIVMLYTHKKNELIKPAIETVLCLGITYENFREMLPEDTIMEPIFKWNTYDKKELRQLKAFFTRYVSYFIKDKKKIDHLKKKMLSGTKCIVNWLESHWTTEVFKKIIMWCHNDDEKKYKKYMLKAVKDGRLRKAFVVYYLKMENYISTMWDCSPFLIPYSKFRAIEHKALADPQIRKQFHEKYLQKEEGTEYDREVIDICFHYEHHHREQSYPKFLLSEEGFEPLASMFSYFIHPTDSDIGFEKTFISYRELRCAFADYEGLANDVDRKLAERGHPNSKNSSVYVRWPAPEYSRFYQCLFKEADPLQARAARRLIDARYRCFRALLNMPKASCSKLLFVAESKNATKFSLDLAEKAGISVPVEI